MWWRVTCHAQTTTTSSVACKRWPVAASAWDGWVVVGWEVVVGLDGWWLWLGGCVDGWWLWMVLEGNFGVADFGIVVVLGVSFRMGGFGVVVVIRLDLRRQRDW